MVVKRGNVRVKIYSTPSNGCDAYTVAYYFAGQRQRKTFADLGLAKLEAEVVANRICAGELDVLQLTSADRTAYVRSMTMLQRLGTPLGMAVMQFSEAAKLLDGASLLEAAKFCVGHHPRHLPTRTVGAVVEEMLAAKEAEGLSWAHVRDMKGRLRQFVNQFKSPIAMVLGPEMQAYIAGLKVCGRSKNDVRKHLKNLFHFARSRGYLPKGLTEADELTLVKETPKPIGIYQPDEMAKLLQHAEEDMIAFLAIGAFAGLRHAEILRHSFISCRVAEIQNVTQVALEAGNSPKIIFSNYRELVKPADAQKWFSILPETVANVIPAPEPAAAIACHSLRAVVKSAACDRSRSGVSARPRGSHRRTCRGSSRHALLLAERPRPRSSEVRHTRMSSAS
jgi:hypothetical protein